MVRKFESLASESATLHAYLREIATFPSLTRADEQVLVFERAADNERLRCTFNLSDRPSAFRPSGKTIVATGDLDGDMLGAYSAVIEEIA